MCPHGPMALFTNSADCKGDPGTCSERHLCRQTQLHTKAYLLFAAWGSLHLKSLHAALSLAMGKFSCDFKKSHLHLSNSFPTFSLAYFLFLGCRMNRAPTIGYESDVGSKTTHHFVYPESYKELAENVSMIVIPFKTLDLRWIVTALTTGTINL